MASALDNPSSQTDIKSISKSANEYGMEFVNKFYKTFDNRRHEMGKFYSDDAKIIWNGNEVAILNRQTFHTELPDSTHNVDCYDVQPIPDEFNMTGHYMILINVSGTAKYRTQEEPQLFYESFILRAFESKWKIVSDCYRFAE